MMGAWLRPRIAAALSLAALGVLLGALSILAVLDSRLPDWLLVPGRFFVATLSLAWPLLPLYCIAGSILLFMRDFRRDLALVLSLSILPFFTLVFIVRFFMDPASVWHAIPRLRALGVLGVGAASILILLLECVLIWNVSRLIFPEGKARGRSETNDVGKASGSPRRGRDGAGDDGRTDLSRMKVSIVKGGASAEVARAFGGAESAEPSLDLRTRRRLGKGMPPAEEAGEQPESARGTGQAEAARSQTPDEPTDAASLPEDEPAELKAAEEGFPTENRPVQGFEEVGWDDVGSASSPQAVKEVLPGISFESVPPQGVALTPKPDGEGAKPRPFRKAKPYEVPVEGILTQYPDGQYWIIDDETRRQAEVLKETLEEFQVKAEVTGIRKGPVITMFEILPAPGVKLSKIVGLQDNIALRLAAQSIRIVAPIPGKHAVGIEVPNRKRAIVSFREMIESEAFNQKRLEIPVVLGKDIQGEVQVIDLTTTPHLLIAGATGAGKSVCVNSLILSVLYKRTPEEVKMIMIDPKIVELKLYNDIPHLLTTVITEPKKAFQALQYCICEMERRYSLLDGMGVRDIRSYNKRIKERNIATTRLPYIVVFIDEFADLMATTGKELESTLARLAAMSRAVGIHLVLATQRPSIDVITGLIKANIPSRIAFMVASKTDSRIIIDSIGAEKLLGRGDMLWASATDPFPIRMQGAFVSEEEVEKAVAHVKTLGEPEYIDDEIFIDDEESDGEPSLFNDGGEDPLMDQALEIVLQQGKASASYIQRRLKIGYNRAARLVELMEDKGIVGPAQGSKPRDIIHMPDRYRPSRPAAVPPEDTEEGAE